MTPSPLTPDLIAAAEQTVARFVEEAVRAALPRPEAAVTPDQSREIVAAALEAGLLGGEGVWCRPHDAASVALSLRTLTAVAEARTGVAYHLHRLALGDAIRRLLQLEGDAPTVPLLDHLLTATPAHARLLAGAPVADPALSTLASPRVAFLAEPWQALLLPVLDADRALRWQLVERTRVRLEPEPAAHGLDDAPAVGLSLGDTSGTTVAADRAVSAAALRTAVGIEALAAVALGLGALRRAHAIARAYARERVQGGAAIIEHAAVQELLGEAIAVEAAVSSALAGVQPAAIDGVTLARRLGLRAASLPRLTAATNACLQVLGGAGYLRDVGVEACVRDVNHLRVVGGTPPTLQRLVALLGEVAS